MVLPDLKYGNKQSDYQMISTPIRLNNNSVSAVFESDFGPYDDTKWRLARWQEGVQIENGEGFNNLTPGNGYWLIVKDPPLPEAEPVSLGGGVTMHNIPVTKDAPFIMPLKKGWNQIAAPYDFNISWTDVLDHNDDPIGVSTDLYIFPAGGLVASDLLSARSGAYVEVDTDIEIEIPLIRDLTIQNGRKLSNSRNTYNNEGEWELNIDLTSSKSTTKVSGIGMKQDAYDHKDRFDHGSLYGYEFLGHTELKFESSDYAQKTLAKDVRSVKENDIWEFTMMAGNVGNINLQWPDISDRVGGKELILYDVMSGKLINMLQSLSYQINPEQSGAFKIYFGTKAYIDENLHPDKIYLGQSYPNPFSSATTIPFTLSKQDSSYEVELSIFNLMGQKVMNLANDYYAPGFYELTWDGKNDIGELQPSGIYIYKLFLKSSDGQTSSYYRRAILK